MKCPTCGKTDFVSYRLRKCRHCGEVVEDFFRRPKEGWKLKISHSRKTNSIEIVGNKAGLEYLASCALSIIGKGDALGHIHLEPAMYNLSAGSTQTLIAYDEDIKGDIPLAATGRPSADE